MRTVNDIKPKSLAVINIKPRSQVVDNVRPSALSVADTNFIYLETRTITKGQPLPWGINWAITYPATLVFQGVRI